MFHMLKALLIWGQGAHIISAFVTTNRIKRFYKGMLTGICKNSRLSSIIEHYVNIKSKNRERVWNVQNSV